MSEKHQSSTAHPGESFLVLNSGSSTVKFAAYRSAPDLKGTAPGIVGSGVTELCRGTVSPLGRERTTPTLFEVSIHGAAPRAPGAERHTLPTPTHQFVLPWLLQWSEDFLQAPLRAVSHRVVHGGDRFVKPQQIVEADLPYLRSLIPLAPLHQGANLLAIELLLSRPNPIPQFACFDTAFHATLPEREQIYALPYSLFRDGVRRYGFHGLSYEFVAAHLSRLPPDRALRRTVIAHLGSGSSVCALLNGESVATTMGFTPLDGVPMGTRCGSIDPGILLYLLEERGHTSESLRELLYHHSGLLGVSESSSEMKELLAANTEGSKRALEHYCYRCAREIASLGSALGGIDALIFTGGIGEHAPLIRSKIAEQNSWLGITLDTEANQNNAETLHSPSSTVGVYCVKTNEELVIAEHTRKLLLERRA